MYKGQISTKHYNLLETFDLLFLLKSCGCFVQLDFTQESNLKYDI